MSDLDDQIAMGVVEGRERNPTSCSWRPYIEGLKECSSWVFRYAAKLCEGRMRN